MKDKEWASPAGPAMPPCAWASVSEEEITRRVRRIGAGDPPRVEGFRPAAVLVPLICGSGDWEILFTRRTDTVQSHKGQVSFPGGAADPIDRSPEETALREAREEVGLDPAYVRVLGRMPHFTTISSYLITPVLARIPWPYPFTLSAEEVLRVFTIPLSWLAAPAHWSERPYRRSNGMEENVIFYQPYDGEILWGISARITLDLLEILRKE